MSKEDILEAIANMSVMEVVELIEAMEEKFGVTAAAAVVYFRALQIKGFGIFITAFGLLLQNRRLLPCGDLIDEVAGDFLL